MQLRNELIPLNINGNLRRGGWTATGRVEGDTDLVQKNDEWLIDGKSLAEYVDLNWRTGLSCHITSEPNFQADRYSSIATVQAGTADRFLAGESLQDISFASRASPANSHEQTTWDFGEITEHILQRHTNYIFDADGSDGSPDGWITETDIDTTDSFTIASTGHYIVSKSNNIWRTLQQIGGGEEGGGEFYRIWFDRANKLFYQPAPPFISPQSASKGTLTKDHIRGTIRVQFHNSQPGARVGQVQLSSVAVVPPETTFNSKFPSSQQDGKIFRKDSGVFAQSQARTDTLAERLYRWLTREYTLQVEVDAGLGVFGDDSLGLDLADRLLMTYDGPAEDAVTGNGVHLNLAAQSLFVYGVDVRFDVERKTATTVLTLEADNGS